MEEEPFHIECHKDQVEESPKFRSAVQPTSPALNFDMLPHVTRFLDEDSPIQVDRIRKLSEEWHVNMKKANYHNDG